MMTMTVQSAPIWSVAAIDKQLLLYVRTNCLYDNKPEALCRRPFQLCHTMPMPLVLQKSFHIVINCNTFDRRSCHITAYILKRFSKTTIHMLESDVGNDDDASTIQKKEVDMWKGLAQLSGRLGPIAPLPHYFHYLQGSLAPWPCLLTFLSKPSRRLGPIAPLL